MSILPLRLATLACILPTLTQCLPTSSLFSPLNVINFDKRSVPVDAYSSNLSKRKLDHSYKRGLHDITISDHPAARGVSKRDAEVALTMVGDGVGWSAFVNVGTPAVAYPVLVDTGSSDLWIQSVLCTSTPCTAEPKWIRGNTSSETDTGTTYEIAYMDGTEMGAMNFYESVSWGGLTATAQLIGIAEVMSSAQLYPWGILGLGNPALSYSVYYLEAQAGVKAETIWQHLVSENAIPDLYGFVVGATAGQIMLGAIDYSKVFTDPGDGVDWSWNTMMDGDTTFLIEMAGMSLNSVSVATNKQVLIDSGSSGIFVPLTDMEAIYANVQNAFKYLSWPQGEVWAFPCDQAPPVEIFFGTQTYLISTATFASLDTFTANGLDYCVGGIMGSSQLTDEAGYWILGDIFLQTVYTAVSMTNNSIGFAPFLDWAALTY